MTPALYYQRLAEDAERDNLIDAPIAFERLFIALSRVSA